jgi:hypothetical protein
MNERAQACLLKAVECEHAARHSKDESVRLLYLDLAKQWRTLAEHVETMDRQRASFEQINQSLRSANGASELLELPCNALLLAAMISWFLL